MNFLKLFQLKTPSHNLCQRSFAFYQSLVCLATFLKVSDNESFDPYQELLKALIGFIDVAGLFLALTRLTHGNISQKVKIINSKQWDLDGLLLILFSVDWHRCGWVLDS